MTDIVDITPYKDYKEVYDSVKDYSDLLNTNIMFFKGELEETFYYGSAWGKGEDQNNHAIVATNNLIKLTEKHRIFTVNGQSSYSDYCTKQRSYLSFYMEENTFEKLYTKLFNDKRIWVICNGPVLNIKDYNFEEIGSVDPYIKSIVLTLDYEEPYSVFNKNYAYRYEDDFSSSTINNILKSHFYCTIIRKDFCQDPNADDILLEHLEHLE